jgi:molybdopterin converting factor small subunit
MQVTLKLFATLMPYLPSGAAKNAVDLDIPADTSINQLIQQHKVPDSLVHLVLLNGLFVNEGERDQPLKAGDTLAIWPPVAGG